MMSCTEPRAPIPEPLRGLEVGTFTHTSVVVRLPDIGRRVLAENELPPPAVAGLQQLIDGIPDAPIRFLRDVDAPDFLDWQAYITPYLGWDWLQVPWFFAEAYFYRRILEATGYFQAGPGRGLDPFAYQKAQGLATRKEGIGLLGRQVGELLAAGWSSEALEALLAVDLWGNQADLSLWPADEEGHPGHLDAGEQQAHLLVDDTPTLIDYLDGRRGQSSRIDFLVDNAGFELVCDLALADYLLGSGISDVACLHLKSHPTFVSDAMIRDVQQTVTFLATGSDEPTAALGRRLDSYLEDDRLQLRQHPFWTAPLAFWQMPQPLRQELSASHLVISKGDANYRRLLGDRHWPYTTPFADIVCYFPAPLLALRTLKSEVAAGLTAPQLERLGRQDPNWLTNGRWGVIQLAEL